MRKLREKRWFKLAAAFAIGIVFGFLLQKGGATDYRIIVEQLLLRDFTVLKIIFSAIVMGSICVYSLLKFTEIDLSIKPFQPGPIIIGGLIFGIGFALLGYCPGTLAGAVGTGSLHALLGAAGMVIGVSFFTIVYPYLKGFIERGNRGKLTLTDLLGLGHWPVIIMVSSLLTLTMIFLELNGL